MAGSCRDTVVKVPDALFVYGTLMTDDRVRTVTGRQFPRQAAVLEGYTRITPARGYPYIIRQPGARVTGSVLFDIDAVSFTRLDRYEDEGRLYLRTPVEALCGRGRIACETYVGNLPALRRAFARR